MQTIKDRNMGWDSKGEKWFQKNRASLGDVECLAPRVDPICLGTSLRCGTPFVPRVLYVDVSVQSGGMNSLQ